MGKHRNNPDRPAPNYPVGYRVPSDAHKFEKGQSGNPKGRPRKSKAVFEQVDELMTEMMTVTVNGRSRRMTRQEVALRNIANAFMKGDLKAGALLFELRHRYSNSDASVVDPAQLPAEHLELLRDYLRRQDPGDGAIDLTSAKDGDAATSAVAAGGSGKAGDA